MTDQKAKLPPRDSGAHLRTMESQELLKDHREVLIDHEGTIYKLRLTKSGNLILNKP